MKYPHNKTTKFTQHTKPGTIVTTVLTAIYAIW